MGKHDSLDLRKAAIASHESGRTQEEVAEEFGICRKTLCNWLGRRREGRLAPTPRRKGTPYKINAGKAARLIAKVPDMTLKELAGKLGACASGVCRHFARHGITRKKKDALPRARRGGKGGLRGKNQGHPRAQGCLRG
jgi:transposase